MPVINNTRRTADAGDIGGPVKKPATQSRPTTSSKPVTSVVPRGQANTGTHTSASKAPTTVVDFRGGANSGTPSNNANTKVSNSLNSNLKPGNATSTIGKNPPNAEVDLRIAVNNTAGDPKSAKKVLYAEANWDDAEDNSTQWHKSRQDSLNGGSFEQLPPILQNAIAIAEGVALDVLFNIDLTSTQTDHNGWSATEIHSMFGSVVRQAEMFNYIAQQNGFAPPSPFWLFRNIMGPLEVRQVNNIYGPNGEIYYGHTSTLQSGITVQYPDGNLHTFTGTWGPVQQALQDGAVLAPNWNVGSSLIELTDASFLAGTVTPGGSNTSIPFPEGFVPDHELDHLVQLNWALDEGNLGSVYQLRVGGQENLETGIPNVGARSYITSDGFLTEYVADAIAYLANNYYDPSNPEHAARREIVEGLLWDLIDQKFNE